ncbi:MAG: HAD family hydrolase [Planctomycetia bacterium]|nr:HAD family hydrolase [Planctomycetia bacterium]
MRAMRSALEAGPGATMHPAAGAGCSLPAGHVPPAALGIGGLVFDMTDVLYDATLWRRWLLRLVNRLGVRCSYASFYRDWDRRYLVDVHCGRREYSEAFQSFLLANHLSWAQIDELEASSRIQRENFELNARPLPGVVKTIGRLAELGLHLVAFGDSPYPAARLSERLERLGLGNRFRTVLSSFDLEAAQPSARCYQSALDALGLSAQDAAYVGHDAAHLAGAKAVGMRTVAFNFERHARADFYLARFEDLSAVIESGSVLEPDNTSPDCRPNLYRGVTSQIHQGGSR